MQQQNTPLGGISADNLYKITKTKGDCMKRTFILTAVLLLLWETAAPLAAKETAKDTKNNLGFIFNTDNILMDIEGYQGGFGFRRSTKEHFIRAMVDFDVSTSSDSSSIGGNILL